MKEKTHSINWKRIIQNNGYMLRMIWAACPNVLVLAFIRTFLNAGRHFLCNAYLVKIAVEAIEQNQDKATLIRKLLLILLYTIVTHGFIAFYKCYYEVKQPAIESHIRNLLFKKAATVDIECFETPSFYDTYIKAAYEATNRAFEILGTIMTILWMTIVFISTATLVFTIEPVFLLIAIVPLLVTFLFGKKQNRIKYEYDMKNMEIKRQQDYIRRVFYLKDYAKEMRLSKIWKVMFRRMNESITGAREVIRRYGPKMMGIRYLYDFLFDVVVEKGGAVLAAYKTVISKTMSVGNCLIIVNNLLSISQNLGRIGSLILALDGHALYVENLRGFLNHNTMIAEDPSAPTVPEFQSLELRNICFYYNGQSNNALSNINLTIHQGEKVAVVGRNGAGKTTLVKLIQRLYDPCQGEILINGRNIKEYRLSSYRSLFGTVFQDYHLFATSVAENVILRNKVPNQDDAAILDSLEKVGLKQKILSLGGQGIDTAVSKEFDEDGMVLSVGEAQALAIARVFAGKFEVVLLDEPTSSLDPIAEEAMYKRMFEACSGKTVMYISHRLSSAAMSDRIYVFDHGEIIEQGTHRDLLSKGGTYAEMWAKQVDTYCGTKDELL